jgi:hypothetical protein
LSPETLSLAYLLWRNWFFKGQKIYANIHLFKIPYIYIDDIRQLDLIKHEENVSAYVGIDELWLYCDSRMSRTTRNRFVSNILAKSRKRGITYVTTAQVADSIESRIRKVLDFTFYPMLNRDDSVIKLLVFRGGYVKNPNYMKTLYYKTELIRQTYDTLEEITMMEKAEVEGEEEKPPTLNKWCFQENFIREHGYMCECDKCGTKFFDKWEDCDEYASAFYKKHIATIKKMI